MPNLNMQGEELRILIVDDELGFLDQAEEFLKRGKRQFEIETSTSAEKALERLEEEDFDAVVADYKMPKMNGIELLEHLREKDNEIPFILFTGKGDEDSAMKALNLDANQYFRKDGDPRSQFKSLGERVVQEIKKNRSRREATFKRDLLQSILDNTPDSVYFKDRENRFVKVSKSKAEHMGIDPEEAVGKTDFDFYPEEQAEEMAEDDRKVMEEEEPIFGKIEKVTRPEGEDRWVSVTKVPRYDEEGNVVGTLGISRDITKRRKNRRRLEKIFEASPDTIIFLDEEGIIKEINETSKDKTGLKKEEVVGTHLTNHPDILSEENQKKVRESFEKEKKGEKLSSYTIRVQPEDKEDYFAQISSNRIEENGEMTGLVAVIRDVTEAKQKEADRLKKELVTSTLENIRGDLVREFNIKVSSQEFGLKDQLDYLANLSTQPSSPQELLEFMTDSTHRVLKNKKAEAEKGEVREVLTSNLRKFIQRLSRIADEFYIDFPSEYRELKEDLAQNQ